MTYENPAYNSLKHDIAALQKSKDLFHAIFEGSRDAIFITDENKHFAYVNQAACALTGYTKQALLSMSIPDLHSPGDMKDFEKFFDSILSGKTSISEADIIRKDDTKVPTEFSSTVVTISGKKFMHTTARDVSTRKQAEAERDQYQTQLVQTQKMEAIGALAGGIAHDFNNILFPIIGHTQMLLNDTTEDGPTRNSLSAVYTSVMRAKGLSEKIFDPFFTTKEKDTGMGLSVVHGIVKGMKGTIQVYSEPGKGTRFCVYLPLEKAFPAEECIPQNISIPKGSEHILLVDDDESIIDMEKLMLERLGYRVASRTSSIEALEAFKVDPLKYDLVISDMAMPKLPGDKLSVELIRLRPDIPILICTGFSQKMTEKKLQVLGIRGLLMKPVVLMELAQKIREILDQK